jgi:thiol:disulfide interchange protein DsbC
MKTTKTERRTGLVTTLLAAGTLAASLATAAATAAGAPGEATTTTTAAAQTDADSLAARLQRLYPSTRFSAVRPTAWPGVFEVAMGVNLAYVDDSGRYFLFGHLFDMQAQRDLTAERKDDLARIDFGALPLADAITEVRGNGSRVLAIFSDPDCPYCRRLEAELADLTDITVHTFLLPLGQLHPQAHAKAVSVWCAADRASAWRALMLGDATPPGADCPHPVDRNVALAEQLGINGTPTLVAADGRLLAGAATRQQIEAWLARTAAGTPGAANPGTQAP